MEGEGVGEMGGGRLAIQKNARDWIVFRKSPNQRNQSLNHTSIYLIGSRTALPYACGVGGGNTEIGGEMGEKQLA